MATMNAPTMDRRTGLERRTTAREGRSAMSAMDYLAMTLLIVGGLNWAMVGLFEVDMIGTIFGPNSPAARLIYVVVGLAALYSLVTMAKMARARRH